MVERTSRTHPEKNSGFRALGSQIGGQPGGASDSALSLGECIAWHRRRRGMTQEVLAGLAGGRTADWLGKVERGSHVIDRLSVLELIADALRIPLARLIDRAGAEPPALSTSELDIGPLRATLEDYAYLTADKDFEPIDLDVLATEIGETW